MIDTLKQPDVKNASEPAVPVKVGGAETSVKTWLAGFEKSVGATPVWLEGAQRPARARLDEINYPTIRDEEWRFTNMAAVAQLPLHPSAKPAVRVSARDIAPFIFDLDCYRLVFVDGHFAADLSVLPTQGNDLQAGPLSAALKAGGADLEKNLTRHAHIEENFFTAMNTAFFEEGAFISIPAGKTGDKPVHLLFVGATTQGGATASPRILILAPRESKIEVIESHVSLADAPRVTNAVTELVLGQNAQVEHCKLQNESERAYHIAMVQAVLAKDSRWISHSIAFGGRIARNQVQARFEGQNSEAVLNGLYLGHGEQLVDHHTVVDHAQPHCESHEYYHGVVADRAHAVFNGKIFVRQDAQKTNAKQTNRNLLLSDHAMIDTKPQLEIFADDVKCTHGATIGQLSDESLFYLQARGIGLETARRMLIQAFASDVVERISLLPVRAKLEEKLTERFQHAAK